MNALDLAGQRFGRLVAVVATGRSKRRDTLWSCRCDCGGVSVLPATRLRRGGVKSCGCLRVDTIRHTRLRHGHNQGFTRSPEYQSWVGMRNRVNAKSGPNWLYYGSRDITMCERWRKFENFIADMGPKPSPKHTIDRINNDGNYEPGNCRWATASEQVRNRRVLPKRQA